ncbi:MAG: bifunctional precorrin-2 dehydrogenase/sirohydrochlorin ferrochelatase [Candidatus Omnitrophota bacterium]
MKYLPVAVNLKYRRTVVVGGGKVALRKIRNFLNAGAFVHVVSPSLDKKVKDLYKTGKITWTRRDVRKDDISDAALIVSATNDEKTNEYVSQLARKKGIPVNVVDQPKISDFISPAVVRSKKAIIAVYTDGKDPVLSRDIKNFLKEKWDEFLLFRNRS